MPDPKKKKQELPATRQDSLAVYNNALEKEKFYKNNKDYKLVKEDRSDKSQIDFKNPNIVKSLISEIKRKNIRNIYFPGGTNNMGKINDETKKRIGQVTKNTYSAPDFAFNEVDYYYNPKSPRILISDKIKPQGSRTYESVPKLSDISSIPYYDPLAVKPFDLLTEAEKTQRVKKYGRDGVPDSYGKSKTDIRKPNITVGKQVKESENKGMVYNDKLINKPKVKQIVKDTPQVQSIPKLNPVGLQFMNPTLNITIPNIPIQAKIPKSYSIQENINQNFGGSQTNYKVDDINLLPTNDLGPGNTRKITPQYAMGGQLNNNNMPDPIKKSSWNIQQAKVKAEKDAKLKLLLQDKEFLNNLKEQSKKNNKNKEVNIKPSDATKVVIKNRPELTSKAARNKTDKEIAEEREAKIQESIKYQDVPYTSENWREVLAKTTQATGDKFRVSNEPNFFDDYLNPAVMIGSMASNLGQAPQQAQQSDSYLPYVTAFGTPLAVGALAGIGAKNTGQFVNNLANPLAGTGDLINNLGNKYLPNAYKLNPNAFKPNPESYYRMIGDEGLADLQNVGYVRSNPNTFYADKNPFFSKGYPIDGRIGKSVVEDSKYLGNNMIEVGGNNEIGNRFVKNRWADAAPDPNIFVARDKIGIDNPNLKVFEKDWLKGYKQVEVPKPTSNFKSEINWGKWNKEIPENTQLMKEYNAIEQQAKANGTWMKNPDGSPFKGTPEQFVQQNSENFKKSFGNSKLLNPDGSPTIQYHGSAKKFDTFDESKFQLGDAGYSGSGIYTTPNKTKASSYSLSSKSIHKDGNLEPTIYELYGKGNNPISAEELIKQKKDYDLFNFHRAKDWQGDVPLERQMREYDVAIRNQTRGVERISPWNDADELVFPTNKQLKSAIGNNGMFDMTNPNIYKSVVPIAGATYLATQGQEEPKKLQQGGYINQNTNMNRYVQGGDLTQFNEGGTHEQNPLGGIPQGTSNDGKTNMVEQGETKNSNYIYSNRLSISKDLAKQMFLPNYIKNKSFADASKSINDKFKDRNDTHSNTTKKELLDRLTQAQESVKAQQEQINQAIQANSQQIPDQMNGEIPEGMEQFAEGGYYDNNNPYFSQDVMNPGTNPMGPYNQTPISLPSPAGLSKLSNPGLSAPTDMGMSAGQTPIKGGGFATAGNVMGGLGIVNSLSQGDTAGAVMGGAQMAAANGLLGAGAQSAVGSFAPGIGAVTGAIGLNELAKGNGASRNKTKSAITGAMTGAAGGAAFGPGGIAVGAGIGAIAGGIGSGKRREQDAELGSLNAKNANNVFRDKQYNFANGGPLPLKNPFGEIAANAYNKYNTPLSEGTLDNFDLTNNLVNQYKIQNPVGPLNAPSINNFTNNFGEPNRFNREINPAGYAGYDSYANLGQSDNLYQKPKSNFLGKLKEGINNNTVGNALRLAPVAMNAYQLAKLKKPGHESLSRLSNTYKPQFIDEASLQNAVGNENRNTINALTNSSGGSEAALRAGILGANLNATRGRSDAYMKMRDYNNQQNIAKQQFQLGVDQTNMGQSNMENEINAKNLGNYDTQKSKLLGQIGTDLGSIGKEKLFADKAGKMFGYDENGKYILTPEGKKSYISDSEESTSLTDEQKAYLKTMPKAFGGYLRTNKKGY